MTQVVWKSVVRWESAESATKVVNIFQPLHGPGITMWVDYGVFQVNDVSPDCHWTRVSQNGLLCIAANKRYMWSISVQAIGCWLLDHVIYLKLRRKVVKTLSKLSTCTVADYKPSTVWLQLKTLSPWIWPLQ